jgi:hypothetical protein
VVAIAIGACEIGFWCLVVAGVLVRRRWRRAGAALMLAAPLTDLVLLTLVAISLRAGRSADSTTGLAAVYLGVSVVFGRDLVGVVDRSASPGRQRTAGADRAERARRAWAGWRRAVFAASISAALLGGCIALAGDADTRPLVGWYANLAVVLLVWLLHPLAATLHGHRSANAEGPPASDRAGLRTQTFRCRNTARTRTGADAAVPGRPR